MEEITHALEKFVDTQTDFVLKNFETYRDAADFVRKSLKGPNLLESGIKNAILNKIDDKAYKSKISKEEQK